MYIFHMLGCMPRHSAWSLAYLLIADAGPDLEVCVLYMHAVCRHHSIVLFSFEMLMGTHATGTDSQTAARTVQKAPGLQRVEELMRVVASRADVDQEAAVRDLLMPLLAAVQGVTRDVVAVHDKAVGEVLGEVRSL